jgi:pilus assembly protein CpaF
MNDRSSLREKLQRKSIVIPSERIQQNVADTSGHQAREVGVSRKTSRNIEYQSIKGDLHERLIDELNQADALALADDELKTKISQFVESILDSEELPLNENERSRISNDLVEETLGTGPLASLMADSSVTDILVNRYDQVYVERFGILQETGVSFRDDDHLIRIIERMVSRVGRRIDTSSPMVDARLPDGSRINATLPPATIDGPTLSIRRFGRRRMTQADLLRLGMFSDVMRQFLNVLVRQRKSIVVTGGTGSGKSTLLSAIAEAIPDNERIITIEDAAELMLMQKHVIRMETRVANAEGKGRITQRELVINALRMRPDRIVMGEVRAGEALDMLQAMNTGHDGSLTTIHANSPRDAFSRLETMVMMADVDLPSAAIREHSVSALDYLVHVRRYEDGQRRVERISEVVGLEGKTPQLQDIFTFQVTGRVEDQVVGEFRPTGIIPRIVDELSMRASTEMDRDWFGRQA